MTVSAEKLTVKYGSLTIVDSVDFKVEPGQWLMIVGPNGAGKSTIVGALSQNIAYSGRVLIDDVDASKLKPANLAQKMGVLAQKHNVGYSFSVEEIVRLGRYAYSGGIFSGKNVLDEQMVERAMEMTGISHLKHQSALTLSGGELQRTFLAQVFAQDPQLLVLDEPSNHLDLVYQRQVFSIIQQWIKTSGKMVLSVVHDLSLAKAYGTHALLLDKGRRVAYGPCSGVLTRENLKTVYNMDVYGWMQNMLSQWKD